MILRLLYIFILPIIFLNSSTDYNFEYSYIPKVVYKDQVFPITFISNNINKVSEISKFNFSNNIINTPLNDNPILYISDSKVFYTFYFKAKNDSNFTTPSCKIIINNKTIVKLNSHNIPIKKLIYREDFSNIIAFNLKIKNYKTSIYDMKNNILTLTMEANDANFEDIVNNKFKNIKISKIYKLNFKFIIEYSITFPYKEKTLSFVYFDSMKEKFIKKIIPLTIKKMDLQKTDKSLISKDESFDLIKFHSLIIIIVLSLLGFLIKYDFIYFIIGFISFIVLVVFFLNLETVKIKKNSPIYIIPTLNSTIATYTKEYVELNIIKNYKGYSKILYNNTIIGWVKNENVTQN